MPCNHRNATATDVNSQWPLVFSSIVVPIETVDLPYHIMLTNFKQSIIIEGAVLILSLSTGIA